MLQDLIDLINEFSATGAEVIVAENGQIEVHSDTANEFDEDVEATMEHNKKVLEVFVAKYSNEVVR